METTGPNTKQGTPFVPTVLLADTIRSAGTARLAIEFKKRGINVAVACQVKGHPVLKTSAARQVFPYSGLRPLSSLVTAIEAAKPQIIVPCDDRSVQHLHELHASARRLPGSGIDLAALIEYSLGAPESFPIVSSRQLLLALAREEGIRTPETRLVEKRNDLKLWFADHSPPYVLKSDGTWGGSGVKIAHTVGQAMQSFAEIAALFGAERAIKQLIVNRDSFWLQPWWNRARPAVIVQAHVQGIPANCAVFSWKGKVLAGIAVEVVSTEGLTGPATIVRVVESAEMMNAAEKLARRLNLSGFFGLDFMIERESRATYLIEMNPRCTPLCHLRLSKGRDMVGALAAHLSDQPFRETPSTIPNDMIAYFPQAWRCKSKFLDSSFQDVPDDEPALVTELLKPRMDLGIVAYLSHLLREMMEQDQEFEDHVFTPMNASNEDARLTGAGNLQTGSRQIRPLWPAS